MATSLDRRTERRAAFARARVPYGFCCCGCGEQTTVALQNDAANGRIAGEPNLWRHGHYRTIDPLTSYSVEDHGHETPCWVWQRSCNDKGYALLYLDRKRGYAHRWFYERFVGPIPQGHDLDHLCRTTRCVRPEHLEPVTHAVNMQRSIRTKLTVVQVAEIRRRFPAMPGYKAHRCRALAAEFGVSPKQIGHIAAGRQWRNVAAA